MSEPAKRREVVAWSLFDTANSAFFLVVVTAMYPFFFRDAVLGGDIAQGDLWWGRMLSLSAVLVACTAPFMGALAEAKRWRKRLLAAYTTVAVLGTASLGFGASVHPLVAAGCFVLANAATEGGMVFYASLLPSVATPNTMGRISGIGWAAGYLGSILCLLVAAFGIGEVQPATFVWVAGWFGFFSLPLFLMVRDRSPAVVNSVGAFQGLLSATKAAWKTRDLRRFLIAYFIYNDAVTTTIGFAALFASDELGFPQTLLILMIIGVQVTGAVGALGFGVIADRIGTVRSILLTLVIWIVISVSSFGLAFDFAFWSDELIALGPLELTLRQLLFLFVGLSVGFAMGAVQSQSRTLLATMVPEHRTAEFFGLYAVCGRFSAVLGPLIFGWLSVMTGSKAMSVLALAVMFIIGAVLMLGVDEERGKREMQ